MRRRAIPKCIQHAAEALLDFLRSVAGDLERAQHDVGPMVPDRAARQLDAVADDVVLVRFDRQRILRVERLESALRHRERIVAEGHLAGFRIALVERKVGNPAELVGVRLDDVELAPEMRAQPVHGTADLAGVFGHEKDRVARLRAGRRRQLGPLVVGQELRDRPLRLLRQHEVRHAGETQRLPGLDRSCRRSCAISRPLRAQQLRARPCPSATAFANTANPDSRKISVTSTARIGLRRSGLSLP